MLNQFWRTWLAKAQLIGSRPLRPASLFYAKKLRFSEYEADNRASRPHFQPYEGLADVWQDYASTFQWNYPAFLAKLAKAKQITLRSILDLACGTGTQSTGLADIAAEVVGLDVSEPMLVQARSRSSELPGVRFVAGDFRKFQLGRSFDAAVCACNSLNYVGNVAELREVFRSVAEHLEPDGRFVFDTFTDAGMQMLSGSYLHVKTGGKRFVVHFQYDRKQRKERTEILMPWGTEVHTRIPIDPTDVAEASRDSGLVLEDYFSSCLWPGRWYTGPVSFFVLRSERAPPPERSNRHL